MPEKSLTDLLVDVRRIAEHRRDGAEEEIRIAYSKVLKEVQHFIADEYAKLAENDSLTYAILQSKNEFANFLETVQKNIETITPSISEQIKNAVSDTYKLAYEGMVGAVKKGGDLREELKGLVSCTPEVIKRAVENPIAGLTLKDTLEKNRNGIIYDIKQQIGIGLTNGDRYTTMANRIKDSLSGDYEKAIRIVRTETHRVREAGTVDAARSVEVELKESGAGVQMMKTWKTMKDSRVRPNKQKKKKYNHVKMDGVQIPVEEEFILPSGTRAMAPGQTGVAAEDIHCRCYLSYEIRERTS